MVTTVILNNLPHGFWNWFYDQSIVFDLGIWCEKEKSNIEWIIKIFFFGWKLSLYVFCEWTLNWLDHRRAIRVKRSATLSNTPTQLQIGCNILTGCKEPKKYASL